MCDLVFLYQIAFQDGQCYQKPLELNNEEESRDM